MSELRLFIGFFSDALRSVPKNRKALLFAMVLTAGSADFLSMLLESGAPLERYQPILVALLAEHPSFLLSIPILLGIATFAKGGLVLALSEKSLAMNGMIKRSISLFPKLFGLEVLFILSSLLILSALLIPAILTQETPSLGTNLAFLGLVIFLPIFLVLTFVEAYAFFYIVLSKTSFRTSIELGYSLFMRRVATSIIFGIVSVVVLLGASLISGAFLGIGNGLLQDSMKRTVAIIFGLFIIQSSLVLIQKSAWISFFRFIATEDGSKEEASASQETENVIQREVPEIG